MVKLLRLTTEDNNAIFQSLFRNPVRIEPDSKLALLGLNATIKEQTLIVDFENNEITVSLAGNEYNSRLTRGTYGRANYIDLLQDIEDAINLSMIYTDKPSMLGIEWICDTVDNKVNIGYDFNLSSGHVNLLSRSNDINVLANNQKAPNPKYDLDNSIANPYTGYNKCVIGKKAVSLGNGYFRARIDTLTGPLALTDVKEQGFLIGLSESDLSERNPNSFGVDDVTYGIGVGYDGANWIYYTQAGNTVMDTGPTSSYTGVGSTKNGVVEAMKNGSQIDLSYYDENVSSGARTVLSSITISENKEYYPFIVFHSNENQVRLNTIRWTPTTINNRLTDQTLHKEDVTTTETPVNGSSKVNGSLQFAGITLANFLGYNNLRQPTTGFTTAIKHNFIANNEFEARKLQTPYILELINLNVESFDSSQKQRKNILATDLVADENGYINYKGNVIFIDLNNKDPIDLRNISLRIVGRDYESVAVTGETICNLLIGGPDESSF